MNFITQFKNYFPLNCKQQTIKEITPLLDKSSAIVTCIALNVIFSFLADKTINYYNNQAEKPAYGLIIPEGEDPPNPVLQKNKYINSGLYLSCMLVVNIVVISKFFSISPAKPALLAASVLAVGRHVYRDWCEKNTSSDVSDIYFMDI